MRKFRKAVLAGIAAIAAAGAAVAASQDTRMMTVALPDGAVARIEYEGDVAPKVVVAPARARPVPIGFVDMFDVAPLALFDRVFEQLDRQADLMLRQAAALEATPLQANGQPNLAAIGNLPAGTVRYSFVSTSSGEGACTRSVRVTSIGRGAPPEVVSNIAGNCAGSAVGTTPAAQPHERHASPTPAAQSSAAAKPATTI